MQTCVDYHIGRVLYALGQSAYWDNTMILFTSDHGEYGGSHWLHGKGATAYEESIHVPFYFSFPAQRGTYSNFNNSSSNNTATVNYVCSSVDVLPLLYSSILGNESWRLNSSDPVNYLSGRQSMWDLLFLKEPVLRRTVTIDGSEMAYSLHTSDDVPLPINSSTPNHVVAMRTVNNTNLGVTKFVQYSPWPNIPLGNNNPPVYTNNMASNYTQPYGNNTLDSQFELYLPTNLGELANDYGTNLSTAANYANGMYTELASELYAVPPTLQTAYNNAFSNYWNYVSAGYAGEDEADETGLQLL